MVMVIELSAVVLLAVHVCRRRIRGCGKIRIASTVIAAQRRLAALRWGIRFRIRRTSLGGCTRVYQLLLMRRWWWWHWSGQKQRWLIVQVQGVVIQIHAQGSSVVMWLLLRLQVIIIEWHMWVRWLLQVTRTELWIVHSRRRNKLQWELKERYLLEF